MPRRDAATHKECYPECGARVFAAPCRLCKGTGQLLLFFKCRDCRGAGKKLMCPNFLAHLRAQFRFETSSPKDRGENRETAASSMVPWSRDFSACSG
jgi:RecJ-like exonuclease